MKKKSDYIIFSLSILAILCLIPALFPSVQKAVIAFVELHKHDDINDPFWAQQMFAFASLGIIFIVITNLVLLTSKGKEIFLHFIKSFEPVIANIKQNKKFLFILMGLYFIGYFSIIRANFWNYAVDDLPRQMEGSREWVNFYRYIAEIGSIFIHTSMKVFDIAPLTQFIAMILVSFASFFAIDILADKNYSIKTCIAAMPIGLFPFFLSNYSYRYDSPYMALSLCISIIPFLFYKNFITFIISSVTSLLIMCISYQASSGIYIFMSVLVFLKMFLKQEKSNVLLHFTITSILCYAFTLLLFSFLFIEQAEGGSYVDESINLNMIIKNTKSYISTLGFGLGKSAVSTFSILTLISFLVSSTQNTTISKLASFFVTLFASLFCIPFTIGSYLALQRPEFIPRAFIGIGVFMGCISIFTLHIQNKKNIFFSRIAGFIAICFSYSCLAFSFAFGNAQYTQKEYIRFRGTILAQDLSECISPSDDDIELLFKNNIGYAPAVEVLADIYPLVKESVDIGFYSDRDCQFILESLNLLSLKEKPNHDFRNADFPILKETAYHKIQGQGNKYIITFKTPKFKTVKTRRFIAEQ